MGVIQALSSPHYTQSNGHAEAAVKAMKNLVAKSTESGNIDSDEFCEGLLEWLNTPKGHGLSPAEVLYGSPLRSIIPAAFQSYAKYWEDKFEKWDETMSTLKRGEEYYNKQAKPLTPFKSAYKTQLPRNGITVAILSALENIETIKSVYQVDECTGETDASSDQP